MRRGPRRPPHPWFGPAWLLAMSLVAVLGTQVTRVWAQHRDGLFLPLVPTMWPLLALAVVLPVGAWVTRRRDVSRPVRWFRRAVWLVNGPMLVLSLALWTFLAWMFRPWPLSLLDGLDGRARAGFLAATGSEAPARVVDLRYRTYDAGAPDVGAFLSCRGVPAGTFAEIVARPPWSRSDTVRSLDSELEGDLRLFMPPWFPADSLTGFDTYHHGPHEWTRLWYRERDGALAWLRWQ